MARPAARIGDARDSIPPRGSRPLTLTLDRPTALPIVIEAHDRQQLEVQSAHPVTGASDDERFDVELFLFIPRNVGVTAANYPRDEFYGDLTTYLRVDLPAMSLDELVVGAESPLVALGAQVDAIRAGKSPVHRRDAARAAGKDTSLHAPTAVEVKLFGHTFTEAVRRRLDTLIGAVRALPDEPVARRWVLLDEVDRFAESGRAALAALRRAGRALEPFRVAVPSVLQTFRQTDEYSSLYLDGAFALLAQATLSTPALFDGTGFVGRLRQTLARHARAEAEYRAARGYLNFAGGAAGATEYFAYRQSFLKKAVQQALYVDTRRLTTDRWLRNATGAVAASLAATWALVAQVPAQLSNLSPAAQTALVAMPVLAYAAKDRIKELTREWLIRRFLAFDTNSEISVGSLAEAGLGAFSGSVRERVNFIDLPAVDADVRALRAASHTVFGADLASECVLRYHRRLTMRTDKQALPQPGLSLRQIVRLNLRHFLTRLDEPQHPACHYAPGDDSFVQVDVPKVYHLNLVARVKSERGVSSRRWRIIMNKDGIVRIETPAQ